MASKTRLVRLATLAAALLPLIGPPVAASGSPQSRFSTRVDVVQMQVSVADAAGDFVAGLTADDFRLRVNGRDRALTAVYDVDLAEGRDPASGVIPDEVMPPAAWRQWVLFFDAAFNSPRGIVAAQEAARNFIDTQVHPRDLVGVVSFSVVTGVRLLVPLTTDRSQVLGAIEGLGLVQAARTTDVAGFSAETMSTLSTQQPQSVLAEDDPAVGSAAAIADGAAAIGEALARVNRLEFQQYTQVVAQYADQVSLLGELLQAVRGRKHVVYFSRGFADRVLEGQALDELAATTDAIQENPGLALANADAEERFGSAEVRAALDDSLSALRAADAVVHVVDASGVGGERDSGLSRGERAAGDFSSRGGSRAALAMLSGETNGTATWNTNDIVGALDDLERTTRAYYVLAFQRQPGDDGVLDVDVDVTRSGVEVVWAPTQLAALLDYSRMSELQRQSQLAEFISKGIVETDLRFDVATASFAGDAERSRLATVIEVPWEQLEELANAGEDDRVDLDVLAYVLGDRGEMLDVANGRVGLDMRTMRNSPAAGLPLRYYDLLWARPGARQVRVILRDREVGRISSYTGFQQVPAIWSGETAMAGPVAIDWQHPGLVIRGVDPETPPVHKVDGPVDYPFMVGTQELTPAARAAGSPGSLQQLLVNLHHLGRHPFTGQPNFTIAVHLTGPGGDRYEDLPSEIVASAVDPASGAIQLLLGMQLPESVAPGHHVLIVAVADAVTGRTLVGEVGVTVAASEG